MAEEQPEAEAVWPYIAVDIFVIVFGLLFIWGVFWH